MTGLLQTNYIKISWSMEYISDMSPEVRHTALGIAVTLIFFLCQYSTLHLLPPIFPSYFFECSNSNKSAGIYNPFIHPSFHCLSHLWCLYFLMLQSVMLVFPSELFLLVYMCPCKRDPKEISGPFCQVRLQQEMTFYEECCILVTVP